MRVVVAACVLAGCYRDGSSPAPPVATAPAAQHGVLVWARSFGNGDDTIARGFAVDADDTTYVVGRTSAELFGVDTHGGSDAFVVALAPDGVWRWAHTFGGAGWDEARAVAIAPGRVVIAGSIVGEVDFPSGRIDTGFEHVPFLAELAPDGKMRWARVTQRSGGEIESLALAANGDLVIAGWAVIDAGSCRAGHVAIARLSGDLQPLSVTCVRSNGNATVDHVALDAAGDIVACGTYHDWIEVDGKRYAAKNDTVFAVQKSVFVARIARDGRVRWVRPLAGAYSAECGAIAVDARGEVAIGGTFHGTLALGADTLEAATYGDAFAVTLAADGSFVRARSFGAREGGGVHALLFDGGELLAGGRLDRDAFAAAFEPHARTLWLRRYRGGDIVGLARTGDTLAVLGSVFSMNRPADVDLGGGSLSVSAGHKSSWFDFFVARVQR